MTLGQKAIEFLGADQAEIAAYTARIRERDRARFEAEVETENDYAGRALFSGRRERASIDLGAVED